MGQHKYGQHYTPKVLTDNYKELLKKIRKDDLTVVDPFVGQGNLLVDYLSMFSREEAIKIIKNKKIRGYDIDKNVLIFLKKRFISLYGVTEEELDLIFFKNNSLVNNPCEKEDFIFTNPPYLARNTCKRKFLKDYKLNFKRNYFSDYYEISLCKYRKHNGIWIIPANFISSDFMSNMRSILLKRAYLKNIFLFETPIFKDTSISVVSFLISQKDDLDKRQTDLNINFINGGLVVNKKIDINESGFICNDWLNISKKSTQSVDFGLLRKNLISGDIKCSFLNEEYNEESISINLKTEQHIKGNILYLRSTDTGSIKGRLGLYTFDELYPNENKNIVSLLTKKTSRLNVPIFFEDKYNLKDQLLIKNETNRILEEYRDKYNSIFLTNFKNSTKTMQRKRITFTDMYQIIEKAIQTVKKI